jgi:hypothetical protein
MSYTTGHSRLYTYCVCTYCRLCRLCKTKLVKNDLEINIIQILCSLGPPRVLNGQLTQHLMLTDGNIRICAANKLGKNAIESIK